MKTLPILVALIMITVDGQNPEETRCPILERSCNTPDLKVLSNITTWEDCGRHCRADPPCNWWTYERTPAVNLCHLKLNCKEFDIREFDISGRKLCPRYISFDNKDGSALCQSCGGCDCCLGICVFGNCGGICAGNKHQSIDEACLMTATKISNEECSADCADQGGSQTCQSCLERKNPEVCGQTSSTSCWSCALAVGRAAWKCYNTYQTDWKKVLECVILNIPSSCASCACKLVCRIFPPSCKLCETTEDKGASIHSDTCKAIRRIKSCVIIKNRCKPGYMPSAPYPKCGCTCVPLIG